MAKRPIRTSDFLIDVPPEELWAEVLAARDGLVLAERAREIAEATLALADLRYRAVRYRRDESAADQMSAQLRIVEARIESLKSERPTAEGHDDGEAA